MSDSDRKVARFVLDMTRAGHEAWIRPIVEEAILLVLRQAPGVQAEIVAIIEEDES